MNTVEFASSCLRVDDPEGGITFWVMSLLDGDVFLCAEGEATIRITVEQQAHRRSEAEWLMFMISKGSISPMADRLAKFCALTQESLPLSIGDTGPDAPVDEQETQTQPTANEDEKAHSES